MEEKCSRNRHSVCYYTFSILDSPSTAASASICATERRTLVNNMFGWFFFLLLLHINIHTHIGERSTRTFRLAVHCCVVFHIILELNCRSSSSSSSSLPPPLPPLLSLLLSSLSSSSLPRCFNPQHTKMNCMMIFSWFRTVDEAWSVFVFSDARARASINI